ncbi:hypothetical protein AB6A40_008960 [Gnathostoma spinigerum]|uniref:Uncharacterized protein n=1 Tax=Gnathostoma spinigerum TaxID=75299 RepID=A0ABD6EQY0_9BILA
MDIESEKSEEEELLRPPPVAPPAMNDRIIDTMPQGAAPPSAVLPFPPPPPRAIAEPPSPSPPPPPPPPPPSFPVVNLSSALAPPQPPAISHASPYESMSSYPIANTGFPPLQNAPDVHGNLMSHASNINCALPYSSQSVSAQQTLSSATPTLTVASAPPPFAPPVPPLILSSSIAVPIPRSSSPPVAATMKSSSSAIPQNPYASTTSIPPTHLMPPPPVPSGPPVPSSFSLSATGATPSSAFISLSNSSAIVRPSISSLPPLPAHMQPSCGIPLHTQDLQTKMEFPENFTPLNSTDSVQENILKRRGAESAGVPYSVCVTSSMPVAVTVASSASFGYNVLQSHKRPLISSALPNISSSSQTPEACPKSLPGPPPVPLRAWLNSSSALSTSAGSSNQIGTTLSSGLQSVPNLIMSSPLQADSRPHFTPITPILSTTSVFPLPSSSANSSSPFSLPQSSFPSANMNSVSLAYVTTAGTHTSGTIVTQSYSSLNLNDEKYGNSPSNCAAAIHFARPPPVISDAQRFSITNQTHPTGLLESTQIQRKSQSYSATVFMENDHLKGRQQLADDNRAGFGSFVSATESVQQRPTSPVSSPITTLPSSHTVMQTLFSALAIPRARPNNKPIESSSSQPQGGLASGFLTLSNPMTSSLSPSKLPSVASSQSAFSTSQSGMNTTATSSEVPGVHSTHGVSILGATTGSSALFDRYRYTFPGPGEFRYQERQPLQQHSFPPTSSAKSATNEEDTLDFSWPPAGFDQEDEQTVRKQGAEPVHRTLLGNRRGTYRGRWGFRARGRGNHNGSEGSRGIRRDDRFGRDSGPRRGGHNFERNLKGNRQRKVDREEAVFSEACGNKCHDTGGGVISFDDLNHKCPQDSHDGNEKQMLEPDASKEEGSSTLVTPVEEPAKVVGDEACDEEPGVPPDSALSEINENSKTGGEASTLKENSSEVNQISSRQSSEVKQSSPEVCHGGSTQEASATTADSSPAKVTTTEETEKPKFISYPRGKHSKFRQRPLPVVGCRGGIMCASESAATYNRPPISLKASMPLRAIPPYRPPPPFPGFLPARMRLPHPPPPRIPLRFPPPARFPPRFHPPEKLSFFR